MAERDKTGENCLVQIEILTLNSVRDVYLRAALTFIVYVTCVALIRGQLLFDVWLPYIL